MRINSDRDLEEEASTTRVLCASLAVRQNSFGPFHEAIVLISNGLNKFPYRMDFTKILI